jgi:hypothetical protein
MKEFIITAIIAIALASSYFTYQNTNYYVDFCKSLHHDNLDKIDECVDSYNKKNHMSGFYDANTGKPIQ